MENNFVLSPLAEVVLGALFHDIGKFAQRANEKVSPFPTDEQEYLPKTKDGRYTHRHALYTLKFLEDMKDYLPKSAGTLGSRDANFINLAARHHRPSSPYEWIIAEADRLSAGMDREEEEHEENIASARLISVFSEIELDKPLPPLCCYELDCLEPEKEAIFPKPCQQFNTLPNYTSLWQAFKEEFKKLPFNKPFNIYLPALLTLLEKYTWAIPSAVYLSLPDISLYAHSISTAALASCLYVYHSKNGSLKEDAIKNEKEKKFLLVSLDLSGIQKFIFDITVDAARGAAKILRARSFYLSLLSEVACLKLLDQCGLYLVNRIMDAGGRSILLLPNLEETKATISAFREEIDAFLKEDFFAELSLNVAVLAVNGKELIAENFAETLNRLNYQIEKAKKEKFKTCLQSGDDFLYKDFTKHYDPPKKDVCDACGKHYGKQDEDGKYYCSHCEQFREIGRLLPNCEFVAFGKEKADERAIKIFDWYVHLFNVETMPTSREKFYLCYALKAFPGFPLKYIANYVPRFSKEDEIDPRFQKEDLEKPKLGEIKTFHHLALSSLWQDGDKYKGRSYLGVLKADVDRLGFTFSYGLRNFQDPKKNKLTIARFCFLSRMLDFFFSAYLPFLLQKEKIFSDTYTVFAGGDDLFLIGPWENMVRLADKLYQDFRRYTANNPNITLSATVTLVKPRFPVNTAAHLAEEGLKKAKDGGRDKLCVFNELVAWKDFKEVKDIVDFLHSLLNRFDSKIGTGFVYKLWQLADMKEKFEKGDVYAGRWLAMLKYLVARHLKELSVEDINFIFKVFSPEKRVALKVPLSWVLLKNRR